MRLIEIGAAPKASSARLSTGFHKYGNVFWGRGRTRKNTETARRFRVQTRPGRVCQRSSVSKEYAAAFMNSSAKIFATEQPRDGTQAALELASALRLTYPTDDANMIYVASLKKLACTKPSAQIRNYYLSAAKAACGTNSYPVCTGFQLPHRFISSRMRKGRARNAPPFLKRMVLSRAGLKPRRPAPSSRRISFYFRLSSALLGDNAYLSERIQCSSGYPLSVVDSL